jgi:hypothetical protein
MLGGHLKQYNVPAVTYTIAFDVKSNQLKPPKVVRSKGLAIPDFDRVVTLFDKVCYYPRRTWCVLVTSLMSLRPIARATQSVAHRLNDQHHLNRAKETSPNGIANNHCHLRVSHIHYPSP